MIQHLQAQPVTIAAQRKYSSWGISLVTYIELLREPVLYVCPAAGDAQIVRSQALDYLASHLIFTRKIFLPSASIMR